jgi:serine/threonine protein kinase
MELTSTPKQWDGIVYHLKTISHGVSGIVLLMDDSRVIKIPLGSPRSINDIEIEREVYRRLENYASPYIVKCLDYDEPLGIILEKMEETVKRRVRRQQPSSEEQDVLKWTLQAAQGLAHLHRCGVVQADVGCHNMLLDSRSNLKLCDFSGCSVDGSNASIRYETRAQQPFGGQPNKKSDIFALGTAMYEMSVGHEPYPDLSDYQVSKFYEASQFPDDYPIDRNQHLWAVIKKCWNGEYDTADEVATDLQHISQHLNTFKKSLSGADLATDSLTPSWNGIHCNKTSDSEESSTASYLEDNSKTNHERRWIIHRFWRKLKFGSS